MEFANIASAAIAQVEVLRGPNSVLYGSDALAGVISLTTARGSTPLPLLTYLIGGGNFGTYHQEGTIGGRYRKVDYFSDYSRFDSSNSIPDDEYHNGTFTGNYGWDLSPASSLRATIHHDQVASGQPGAIQLYGIPTEAEQANEDAYFGVTWEDRTTANWHNLLRYGGLRLRSQYTQFAPGRDAQNPAIRLERPSPFRGRTDTRSAARRWNQTMGRPTRTPTQAPRTRTSSTRSRITASIRISSDWWHFATKMNAGTRAVRRVRSSEATIATRFSFRETYTTACSIR